MKQTGVYILQSLKNGFYYTGSTDNIENRLTIHNKGWVKATKNMRPLLLMRFVSCNSITEAKSLEYRLKKYKRRDILERVIEDGIFPWDYTK
ncbi:hypothetical protein A3H65_04280 [Candidatus Giovannonibacteria bacterium RIFCSPLOWO2_02_FULL_45_14]|uniref:GIY-YIG domain-containing protein n=1 Tax=Candidatus Giovannonibacteria bacterium RIFCSPLOWO2_12_FULL_44_15 TaxID=1798364 RepID=A0A1F5Y045_9BACT|nr:MAG: hypothetical protein A3C75_02475 [Candidatus Giovannonibacteria bacterium RIFCSPHIGHO2_02_FULL_44_31]OGF76207.1 MAG: hypothetical protein A3E62_01990 [Candidatus Giovannonibacteria bacterium RIFCSPHIGHO2_12_FULL_44_29]OGF91048.1 MAG: hypothetical protein A3H65_04280 [Candidatus Giovannonibacteria bacterium RIFCSPLOWO2_02_FULL_45_14]OGF93489.1 MAG: hypothetical protein A3G54_01050 [Candidatus Giovannonibacteria bacterium RIFCSPLOWO2_12_FULL_44_15]